MKSKGDDKTTCLFEYTFKVKTKTEMTIDENFYKKDKTHQYIMMGNAIGGTIRNYLENTDMPYEEMLDFMGGVEDKAKQTFRNSSVYINDAIIIPLGAESTKGLVIKEGTAIEGTSGTAKEGQKYDIKCIPIGSGLNFQLEMKSNQGDKTLPKIIRTIAEGVKQGEIRFGGHKNNNFGQVSLEEIEEVKYVFSTVAALENYLLKCNDAEMQMKSYTSEQLNDLSKDYYRPVKGDYIDIIIEGNFPYGVYQNFNLSSDDENTISGVKNRRIPASSIKGLLRHEAEKIINALIGLEGEEEAKKETRESKVNKRLQAIFGGKDMMGKVEAFDIILEEEKVKEVKVLRVEKKSNDQEQENREDNIAKEIDQNPKYLKIDRFTGGKFEGALMTTKEYQGETTIKLKVLKGNENHLFPIILACIYIAQERLPIGGRTSIGLGIFRADKIVIDNEVYTIKSETHEIDEKLKNKLENYYDLFKGWCKND